MVSDWFDLMTCSNEWPGGNRGVTRVGVGVARTCCAEVFAAISARFSYNANDI